MCIYFFSGFFYYNDNTNDNKTKDKHGIHAALILHTAWLHLRIQIILNNSIS